MFDVASPRARASRIVPAEPRGVSAKQALKAREISQAPEPTTNAVRVDVDKLLSEARRQGELRQRRIQRPLFAVCLGCVLLAVAYICIAQTELLRPDLIAPLAVATVSALLFGGFVSLLSLLPTQPRATLCAASCVVLVLAGASVAMVQNGALPAARAVFSGRCAALGAHACGALLSIAVLHAACFVVYAFGIARIAWSLRPRASVPRRIDIIWSCFVWGVSANGLTLVARIVMSFAVGAAARDRVSGGVGSWMAIALLTVAVLGASKRLRGAIQSRLARQGGELSSALCIASLIGGVGASEAALALGKARFRCVAASDLDKQVLERSTPDARAHAVSRAARFGQVDAFVSHSWSDDSEEKWRALETWCRQFERVHKREPLLWLDKYCIDQDDIDASVRCLPIFLAGCNRLVVINGPSLLRRLWCVIELFTFLAMGGSDEAIEVFTFGGAKRLSATDCEADGDGSGEVLGASEFDARNARCALPDDEARLIAVVEAFPGGIDRFNAEVLVALRRGEERARDARAFVVGAGEPLSEASRSGRARSAAHGKARNSATARSSPPTPPTPARDVRVARWAAVA